MSQNFATPVFLVTLLLCASDASGQSVRFGYTGAGEASDYGRQLVVPEGFGEAEFTMELWIRLDTRFPVGPTRPRGSENQRTNWSNADPAPDGASNWWYEGNFLLDGHCNGCRSGAAFDIQIVGGGRVRWLFGDGNNSLTGVQAHPSSNTATLLDNRWHQLTLVRRWAALDGADLELWIDGILVSTQWTPNRTDMQALHWRNWTATPTSEDGWWWGAEVRAAVRSGQAICGLQRSARRDSLLVSR